MLGQTEEQCEYADHNVRAVYGAKCFCHLENWDCGFESHSTHICVFLSVLVFYVASGFATG
jgi:hypothetical protein